MKSSFFFTLMILLAFLTGCANQRVLDKIQIVQAMGYDLEEGKIKGTLIYPTFQEKGKVELNALETVSDSFDDILPRFDTKSTFPIEIGQLRMVLFGEEFAKQGIDTVVNSFALDPDVGSRMQLGVAEPKAESILRETKNINVPFHLSNKVLHNIERGNLPKMNLHVFLNHYYGQGKDPVLPYFMFENGQVKIDGLALFKKGKYIQRINMRQSFLLKMLIDGTQDGQYKIQIKDNKKQGFILLRNLDVKTRYTVTQTNSIPSLSIDLTMNAQIKEAPPWVQVIDYKNIKKLETKMEDHFSNEIQHFISWLQEYRVDPIGLGEKVRAKSRDWDYERYQKIYPQLKTTVNTRVKIIKTGVKE